MPSSTSFFCRVSFRRFFIVKMNGGGIGDLSGSWPVVGLADGSVVSGPG